MNKQLEKLYVPLTEEDIEHNPLRTPEIYEKYKDFFDTYFSISVMTLQEYDTAYTKFWNFANAFEENAFEVGFYTAVQLLMGVNRHERTYTHELQWRKSC